VNAHNMKRSPSSSGVVINTNSEAYEAFMIAREKARKFQNLESRLNKIEKLLDLKEVENG